MISVQIDKGNIAELKIEGNARQLLAEATIIVKRICYIIGEQEKSEFNKTKVYASTMLMVADSLTQVLKHENVFEKLEKSSSKTD